MKKEIFTVGCTHILVDYSRTNGRGRNIYSLTPLFVCGAVKKGMIQDVIAYRSIETACDNDMFCHATDGKVLNGPFELSYTVDRKDKAHLVKCKREASR